MNVVQLNIANGPQVGTVYRLKTPGSWTIGRGSDCDIVLTGDPAFAAVSRRHGRITVLPEGVWLNDLGSANGTFVNGRRLTSTHAQSTADLDWWTTRGLELFSNDVVIVGDVRLLVVFVSDEPRSAQVADKSCVSTRHTENEGILSC